MFLRPHRRSKDGKDHTYWSLVETVRTASGPRQRTLCYLGELNGSAQARWLKSVEVFNEQGEAQQLKLFPSHVEVPDDDPQVARVLVNRVRLERTRQFGDCFLGWGLWKRLELDRFFELAMDEEAAEVRWSRVAAVLAINRLCAPGSELAIEERWYPATALDDLLEIEEGKINDTRLYRCLDRMLPHKSKLEQHLKQRYGELFGAEFDVLLYDLTSTYVEGAAGKNPMMGRGYSRDHRPDCEQMVIALVVNREGFPFSYETFDGNRADVSTMESILRMVERKYGKARRNGRKGARMSRRNNCSGSPEQLPRAGTQPPCCRPLPSVSRNWRRLRSRSARKVQTEAYRPRSYDSLPSRGSRPFQSSSAPISRELAPNWPFTSIP